MQKRVQKIIRDLENMRYRTGFDESQEGKKKKKKGEHSNILQVFNEHLPIEGDQTGG